MAAQQSVASLRGDIAEALVRDLVTQVRHTQQTEQSMRQLLTDAFADLPSSAHVQVVTIPGIGTATAAVLVAKIVDIERFATPEKLVGYFGAFPEQDDSGVDKYGNPLPPGRQHMSHKGNDRHYLWNAARSALQHNPAIRALYRRLRAKGTRGDIAMGHCMRKLLHLVFAVWKTNRPFDAKHFPWEPTGDIAMSVAPSATAGGIPTTATAATADVLSTSNDKAVGHKRDKPAAKVVTTAVTTVAPTPVAVNPDPPRQRTPPCKVDFAFLRQQVTLEQLLNHLGLRDNLRGRGLQRRGPCPIHSRPDDPQRTFSAHLGKNVFRCFHADCGAHGNVLDLWVAVHHLPLYEAALHLAETFQLRRNREEEPVTGTR